MPIATTRAERRRLERDNAKQPAVLQEIPRHEWPIDALTPERLRVWRSRRFLVQEFTARAPAMVRLSVNVTSLAGERWQDGITWDDLQCLKAQAGWQDHDAVEVYPTARDVVNVANMRHLWVLAPGSLPFAWRRKA